MCQDRHTWMYKYMVVQIVARTEVGALDLGHARRKARHLTLSKSTDQLAVAIKPTLSYYTTLTLCKTYKYKHQLGRIEEY